MGKDSNKKDSRDKEKSEKSKKEHKYKSKHHDKDKDRYKDKSNKSDRKEKDNKASDGKDHISVDDFFTKSLEFRVWLKLGKGTYFEDLTSKEAHKIFEKEFTKDYNKGKLSAMYYDGETGWFLWLCMFQAYVLA